MLQNSIRLIALTCMTAAMTANAATIPECQVRVLQAVVDDLGNHWAAGQLLPATIMRRTEGQVFFCAQGGSCVPQMANHVEAVQLSNCVQGAAIGDGDYRLDPAPAKMGAVGARAAKTRDNVTEKLGKLGLSNAAAGTFAETSVTSPSSHDAKLVARALAGSKSALAALKAKLP